MDLRDAYALAEHLVEQHAPPGWEVEFDGAKRRAGVCRFATRTIGISAPLAAIHDEWEVRDTILHEIAHALAGPRHGHDEHWRRIAVSLGSSGQRCVPESAPRVETDWLGVCSAGHTIGRHRRPERVITCSQCSRTFDVAHLFTWTYRGRPAEMHPHYDAELAAIRSGRQLWRLPVGSPARIRADLGGEWAGRTGRVAKRGRTSYHLRIGRDVVRVPFAAVEPA